MNEIKEIELTLTRLRELRDRKTYGEIRSSYNIVCDRLDILLSKLYKENGGES